VGLARGRMHPWQPKFIPPLASQGGVFDPRRRGLLAFTGVHDGEFVGSHLLWGRPAAKAEAAGA